MIWIKKIGKAPPWIVYLLSPLPGIVEAVFHIALPNVATYLCVEDNLAQFSTVCYFLGYSLGILTLGSFSDIFGRKPLVLICLILYSLVSFLLSYVNNIYFYIALRFSHAYVASVCSVVGQAMLRDSYSKVMLSNMYITMSLAMSLLPSLGNFFGGQIIQYYSWSIAFKILSLFIFLLSLICFYFLPETHIVHADDNFRRPNPFRILKKVFQDRKFILNGLIVGIFNGILYGFYMHASFVFIKDFDISVSVYSRIILMSHFGSFSGALLSRFLIRKAFRIKQIKILGLCISILGSILLSIFSTILYKITFAPLNIIAIFFSFTICALGHSIVVPLVLSTALKRYSFNLGTVGSMFGSFYYLITATILFFVSNISQHEIGHFSIICLILHILSIMIFFLDLFLSKTTEHK